MTRAEIVAVLTKRLVEKQSIDFSDVVSVVQSWDADRKALFVHHILTDNPRATGDIKAQLITLAEQRASSEAEQMMSNDQLSLEELSRLF